MSNLNIEIEKLKEQLEKGMYYYSVNDLWVKSKVRCITNYFKENCLDIYFDNGMVRVDIENIKEVNNPSFVIGSFKWCYVIKNSNNKDIGYVGLK